MWGSCGLLILLLPHGMPNYMRRKCGSFHLTSVKHPATNLIYGSASFLNMGSAPGIILALAVTIVIT